MSELIGKRLELRLDGQLLVATTIDKKPESDAELVSILKELIQAIDAPTVEDTALI